MRLLPMIAVICVALAVGTLAQADEPDCKSYREDRHFYDNFHQTIGNGFLSAEFVSGGQAFRFAHSPYNFTVRELDRTNETAFVFQLESIEGHVITLHDPFRKLRLRLDYCDMKVRIKYDGKPDYRDLYDLTYHAVSIEDGVDGGSLSAPFHVDGQPIVLIGYSTSKKEVAGAFYKLPDGRWGEFASDASGWHDAYCGSCTSEAGRFVGGSRYFPVTWKERIEAPIHTLREVSAKDGVLHLRDEGRGVDIHVDLEARAVRYSDGQSAAPRLLATITNAFAADELQYDPPH